MSVTEVLAQLDQAVVCLEAEGGQLRVRALLKEKPLNRDTIALCRRHKPALLAYLTFASEADNLLLASTGRLAAAWPAGCQLEDDPRWREAERKLHNAYWTLNLDELEKAIAIREGVATEIFAAFRMGSVR